MVETQTRQNTFWLWSDVVNFTRRGDFDFWSPEYIKNDELMSRYSPFGEVVEDITNGVELRKYSDMGELYLRVGNIKEFFTDLDDIKLVPLTREAIKAREKVVLSEQDILMSRSGSLGIITVVTPDIKNSIISSHIMRLRVKKEISPYYIATFLNSSFGKNQILRRRNGSPVPEINHQSLEEIRFFIPSKSIQQKVEQIVKDAFQLKKESEADYQKSQKLLNEALGLTGIEERREMTFWRWSDEVDIVLRIDPNYYQKYFQEMKARRAEVKTTKLEKLSLLIDYGTVPTSPDAPPELGTPYLTGKNIQPNELVLDKLDYLYTNTTHSIRNKAIEAGDVLITQMGTVGNAAVMSEGQGGWFFGSFLIRVRPNKSVSPEWLALVINSDFGKQQIQQAMTTATVRTNTDLPTIKSLEIPVIDKKKETEIVNLYIQSRDKKVLSKQKLQEAKDFVENLVRRA